MITTIYGLIDPTTQELRYIGKTTLPLRIRYNRHISDANKVKRYSSQWVRSVLNKGYKPDVFVLEEVEGDWVEAEQFWISYWKALGARLTNHTIGGEGQSGAKMPVRTQEHRDKIAAALRGKKASPEVRQKLSAMRTGKKRKPFSVDHCRNLSEAHKRIQRKKDSQGRFTFAGAI